MFLGSSITKQPQPQTSYHKPPANMKCPPPQHRTCKCPSRQVSTAESGRTSCGPWSKCGSSSQASGPPRSGKHNKDKARDVAHCLINQSFSTSRWWLRKGVVDLIWLGCSFVASFTWKNKQTKNPSDFTRLLHSLFEILFQACTAVSVSVVCFWGFPSVSLLFRR